MSKIAVPVNGGAPERAPSSLDSKDTLTFLKAKVATAKIIRLVNGIWRKEAREIQPKHFAVETRAVRSVEDIAHWMRERGQPGDTILVHGKPKAGTDLHNVRRKLVNFDAVPRHFVVIDLDKLPGAPLDPAEAAVFGRGLLPDEFHGVRCGWNATAGFGIDDKAKLRLVFWTSRKVSLPEVDAWLGDCAARPDRSIWQAVQAIYLGVEVIGGPDPVKQRWGILPGAKAVEVPAGLEAKARTITKRSTELPPGVVENSPRMVESAIICMKSRTADRIEAAGRRNTFRQVADDCFDRALSEDVIVSLIEAWRSPGDESEAELSETLTDAGLRASDARLMAHTVHEHAETIESAWDGEPLDVVDVEKQVSDALRGRETPIGSAFKPELSFPALLTPAEALNEMRNAYALDMNVASVGADLADAIWLSSPDRPTLDAARELIDAVVGGRHEALDQLDALVTAHGHVPEMPPSDEPAPSLDVPPPAETTPAETTPAETTKPPAKRKVRTRYLQEIAAQPRPPVVQIVKGFLTQGEIVVAVGAPGAGKTSGLQHLLLSVAGGTDFLGRRTKIGAALYIGSENPSEDERRLLAHMRHYAHDDSLPFAFLGRSVKLFNEQGIVTQDERDIIADAVRMDADTGHSCIVIVLDNMRRMIAPGSTSDEANVTMFMRSVERIRDATGASIVVIHHTIRDGSRYAGSGAIESYADSVWLFGATGKNERHRQISFTKLRLGNKRQVLNYAFAFEVVAHDDDGDPITTVVTIHRDPTSALGGTEAPDIDAPGLGEPQPASDKTDERNVRAGLMMDAARELGADGGEFSASELVDRTNDKRRGQDKHAAPLTKRWLSGLLTELVSVGTLAKRGEGKLTRYCLPETDAV